MKIKNVVVVVIAALCLSACSTPREQGRAIGATFGVVVATVVRAPLLPIVLLATVIGDDMGKKLEAERNQLSAELEATQRKIRASRQVSRDLLKKRESLEYQLSIAEDKLRNYQNSQQ